MNKRKRKDTGLIINVPIELAREIFSESGDLPVAKFPAIIALSESIGKALRLSREEKQQPKPTIMFRTRKPTVTHKKIEYPLFTR